MTFTQASSTWQRPELEFVLIAGLIIPLFYGPGRGSADYFLGLEVRRAAAAAPKSGSVPSGAIG